MSELEPSGPAWCARFPTSTRMEDLVEPFRTNAEAFLAALKDAGAGVTVNATWRPKERAYLMHWCWHIAKGNVAPAAVPPQAGVEIDWTHGGGGEDAHTAAILMLHEYAIEYEPALVSRHTQGRAIDMTIGFKGTIHIRTRYGTYVPATKLADLYPIGAGYNVRKLITDQPHWSDDGH